MPASGAELEAALRQARDGFRVLYRSRTAPPICCARQQRRPVATEQLEAVHDLPSADDTELTVVSSISSEAALTLIAWLPRDQAQAAVLLRVVPGFDANTAARVLGKRSGAVCTAACRGLNY